MSVISVIVPVYKVEPYLHQCIDSILNQTFQDFELILVDDGSPDNCPSICDEYAKRDSRIRVIHKENGGLSSARNAGLDIAQGEFVAFIDSDDWVRDDMLEQLIAAQRKHDADLVLCNIQSTYPPEFEGQKREPSPMQHNIFTKSQMSDCLAESTNWFYVVAWNKLYRRMIWDKLRFPDRYIHEDEAVIHRVVGQCTKIVTISDELYFYRQTANSITGQGLRIQHTDKLFAYADRILYASNRGWDKLVHSTLGAYVYAFLDLYYRFPRTEDNENYFQRMDNTLKMVLPYILKSKTVSLRHKIYLSAIRINPKIYSTLKQLIKG